MRQFTKRRIEVKKNKIVEMFYDSFPIEILVSKKLNKKANLISNFTWYQQYKYLQLDNYIVKKYLELDKMRNILYTYTLNLNFSYINPKIIKVDFIYRKYDKSIFISYGKSIQFEKITIKIFEGIVFINSGINVERLQNV